jgi:hypothetical protein
MPRTGAATDATVPVILLSLGIGALALGVGLRCRAARRA